MGLAARLIARPGDRNWVTVEDSVQYSYSSPGISFVGFSGKLVGHTKYSLAALLFPSSKGPVVTKAGGGHGQFLMVVYVKRLFEHRAQRHIMQNSTLGTNTSSDWTSPGERQTTLLPGI